MVYLEQNAPKRIIVIGDLHTDYDIFYDILYQRGVVNKDGEWCGGSTWVVCMGDTFDGIRPGIYASEEYLNKPMEYKLFTYIIDYFKIS